MGAIFHFAYKNSMGGGVPSPVDGPSVKEWPINKWAKLLPYLASMGITVALLPPITKGGSLGAGWDPYDLEDFGSKDQGGRVETRYGSARDVRRFVAIARACGMQIYTTVVHHHADGGSADLTYAPLGADGKTRDGEMQWDKNCFWTEGSQNPDTVPDPQWDMSFGNEFRWLTGTFGDGKGGNGPGYVKRKLARALDIQTQTIGVDGYFMDDLKGTSLAYVIWLLNQSSMARKFAFGEYYDGNASTLYNYVHNALNWGRCGVLDFAQRFIWRDICNNPGNSDMRRLMGGGLNAIDPFTSVTFVEDIDTSQSGPIVGNQLLAFAGTCMLPGYPMIAGQCCYIDEENCYGLMGPIMNLTFLHTRCANGPLVWRMTAYNYLVFERISNPGCLVGLCNRHGNRANPNDWTEVFIPQTQYWPGTILHDATGTANDIHINSDTSCTMWLPPVGNDGRGYVIYTMQDLGGPIQLAPREVEQVFYGEPGLDLGPAKPMISTVVAEIWAHRDYPITATFFTGENLAVTYNRPTSTGFTEVVVSSKNIVPTNFVLKLNYTAAGIDGFDGASAPALLSALAAPLEIAAPSQYETARIEQRKAIEDSYSQHLRGLNNGG